MKMSMIDIIHLIPGKLIYGSGSMLNELYFAIDKYYKTRVKQSIISLSGKSPGQGEYVKEEEIYNYIKNKYNNPVVFMHKIARTQCDIASKALFGNIPFNIINHTQTKNPDGLAKCDKLICVSNYMLNCLKNNSNAKEVVMIRNGVNSCRYENINPLHEEDCKGYFMSGRLNNFNSTKHSKTWLKWLHEHPINGINHWHDYLGDGAHYKMSKDYSIKANSAYSKQEFKVKLNLPGRISEFDKKISYIKRWDVFLYEITGEEGTSMSMLEALACGKPAIINNRPGNNECIQKWRNGFICSDRNSMYERLKNLAKNPNLLSDLQSSTKEHFDKNLDAKYMARGYVEISESMI